MAHDVFLSYSSKDKAAADAVCHALEAARIRVWMAPRDILPGAGWAQSIIAAINGARVMVLVFSGNANGSPQIEREVERAVAKGVAIVPVRIEDVAPSEALEYFISAPHWLDAFTEPLEEHFEKLTEAVKRLLTSDFVPAASPSINELARREGGRAASTRAFLGSEAKNPDCGGESPKRTSIARRLAALALVGLGLIGALTLRFAPQRSGMATPPIPSSAVVHEEAPSIPPETATVEAAAPIAAPPTIVPAAAPSPPSGLPAWPPSALPASIPPQGPQAPSSEAPDASPQNSQPPTLKSPKPKAAARQKIKQASKKCLIVNGDKFCE